MHLDDKAEVLERHLRETLVAQDAGVVDEDVDAAPGRERLLDHGLHGVRVGHRCAVRDRFATGDADLVDDRLGRLRRAAVAVDGATEVIDHHLRAARRERQGMLPAEPTAGTCHDGHAAVESHRHESISSLSLVHT